MDGTIVQDRNIIADRKGSIIIMKKLILKKGLGKAGTLSLAVATAVGGPVSVMALSQNDQDVPENSATVTSPAEGNTPIASLLKDQENTEKPVREDCIAVQFVSAWQDGIAGGMFMDVSKKDLGLPEGAVDAVFQRQMLDDGKTMLGIWTVFYEQDAEMLIQLPHMEFQADDAFTGWKDETSGEDVTDGTKPVDGAVYVCTTRNDLYSVEGLTELFDAMSEREASTTSVTFKTDTEVSSIALPEVPEYPEKDSIVAATLSDNLGSVVAEYDLEKSDIILPVVTAMEGKPAFREWVNEETGEPLDVKTIKDGDTYVAAFEEEAPVTQDVVFHVTVDKTTADVTIKEDETLGSFLKSLQKTGIVDTDAMAELYLNNTDDTPISRDIGLKNFLDMSGNSETEIKPLVLMGVDADGKEVGTLTFTQKEFGKAEFDVAVKMAETETEPEVTMQKFHMVYGDKSADVELDVTKSLADLFGSMKDVVDVTGCKLYLVDAETKVEQELDAKASVKAMLEKMGDGSLVVKAYDAEKNPVFEVTLQKDADGIVQVVVKDIEAPKETSYEIAYTFGDKKGSMKFEGLATMTTFDDVLKKQVEELKDVHHYAVMKDGKMVDVEVDALLATVLDGDAEEIKMEAHGKDNHAVIATLTLKRTGENAFDMSITLADKEDPDENPSDKPENPDEKPGSGDDKEEQKGTVYKLTFTGFDGKKVTLKNVTEDTTIKELMETLGSEEAGSLLDVSKIAKLTKKQANVQESGINDSTTVKSVMEWLENGDVQITAYDSNEKALGCAVVMPGGTADSADIKFSRDTNLTLRTAEDIKNGVSGKDDGKGKGEGVSQDGKGDGVAPPVATADSNALMLYSIGGGVLALTLGGYVIYQKKLRPNR